MYSNSRTTVVHSVTVRAVSCAAVVKWVNPQDVRACHDEREITLDQQADWSFDGLEIRHRLSRFFSVAGFEHNTDRFFRKLNRNVAVQIQGDFPHPEHFRWCSLAALRRLLTLSNTVNTDARSVLACMDWRIFQAARPADPALSGALGRSLDLELD